MSGSTLTVKVGVAQQLSGANWADGASIQNLDSNNGIWLSSAPSPVAGNGAFLAPLGTVQWSAKKGQPWAVVDKGVVTPVNIIVSDDVSGVTDPIALASATAAQLFATGVPVPVLTATIRGTNMAAGSHLDFDVSNYSTAVITGGDSGPWLIEQYDSTGLLLLDRELWVGSGGGTSGNSWELRGPLLRVTNQSAFGASFVIVLSSRPPTGRWDGRAKTSLVDRWSTNTVMALNTVYPFAHDDNQTWMQGLVYASFTASGSGGTSGRFEVVPGAGTQPAILADTGEMVVSANNTRYVGKLVALPPPPYTVQFRCLGTAGTSAPFVTFVQAGGV